MQTPIRVRVVDAQVSACNVEQALGVLESRLLEGKGGYVCFTNVHAAVMTRTNSQFREATNASLLSVADGKPVYWAGRSKGASIGHIPGPDFMLHALATFSSKRHFFFGSTPEVLDRLTTSLKSQFPGLNICGSFSPPFKQLSEDDKQEHYRIIRDAKADFVWVGLGAPKQELWMAESSPHIPSSILLGVGAAFDFHSGKLQRAPAGLRHMGLEWLYRLLQEPKRLGGRYFQTNTLFLWYALRDAVWNNSSHG